MCIQYRWGFDFLVKFISSSWCLEHWVLLPNAQVFVCFNYVSLNYNSITFSAYCFNSRFFFISFGLYTTPSFRIGQILEELQHYHLICARERSRLIFELPSLSFYTFLSNCSVDWCKFICYTYISWILTTFFLIYIFVFELINNIWVAYLLS